MDVYLEVTDATRSPTLGPNAGSITMDESMATEAQATQSYTTKHLNNQSINKIKTTTEWVIS